MTYGEKLRNYLAAAKTAAPAGTWNGDAWVKAVNTFHAAETKERKKAATAEGAEEVYNLYPKKVGKEEALKAITKALKSHPKEYLLGKTNQFREAVEGWPTSYRYFQDGGDRCPHPATWFNQGRYQDDPKEWRRAGARGGASTRPASVAAPELTPAERADQAAFVEKYRTMPEPEKGTFEHSLWLEARRNDAVASVVESATALPQKIKHEQRLRDA